MADDGEPQENENEGRDNVMDEKEALEKMQKFGAAGELDEKKKAIMSLDEKILLKYEPISKVGKGAYGVVWKAIEKSSKKMVAIKKVYDAFLNDTDA